MTKLLLILLIGLCFEAAGVTFLKKGLTQVGEIQKVSVSEIIRVVKSGVTNPMVLAGVFFEALFFGCLIYLLSQGDVSFVWPLTALSFVMTTFAALIFLNEKVSGMRWTGVVFIVIGAAFISYSERAKEKKSPVAPAVSETRSAAPQRPQ
ncbi:MAG TPA: DMT family transporter [Verrucomicrobiae bacterium]|nr:DMT family transporter [Verrucomicrobiae bacterium]